MAKVRLGDVVDHIKDKVDKDATDLEYYVGGEHIDGDEITVQRKGKIQGSTIGPAFHTRFMKGDVLLMSRNPHLRKASMVDFDGICSDVSYVCRTKDNTVLLQSLLPFILQTTDFWKFAEENKKGGLPFFLNWKDFARFEFDLLPIEEQLKISPLLWAIERAKKAYKDLISKTDELVKSQFIEMFGALDSNEKGWLKEPLKKHADVLVGYPFPSAGYAEEGIKIVGGYNLMQGYINWEESKYWPDPTGFEQYLLQKGDIVMAMDRPWTGNGFKMAFIDGDNLPAILIQRTACIRAKDLSNEFLYAMLNSMWFAEHCDVKGSLVPHISNKDINSFGIFVPPVELQREYAAFYKQSDKSKFEAQQALEYITAAQKSLMRQLLDAE